MRRKIIYAAVNVALSGWTSVQAANDLPPELKPSNGVALGAPQSQVRALAPARIADPARAIDPDPGRNNLLGKARLWAARNRDDLAIEAINKLLRAMPDDPDGLALLAELQLHADKKDQMRLTLEHLRRVRPDHPALARIDTLVRLDDKDKEKLRQARTLAKAGRVDEALAAMRALYPGGPPSGDLTLEYWQLVADTKNGWEAAYAGLSRLSEQYPDNRRYRLAIAEHLLSRKPDHPAALKTVTELAKLPLFEKPARAIWRRAMLKLEPSAPSIALVEQYLQQEKTEDAAAREYLEHLRQALEQHRKLMADPYYRAGLDGLALLNQGKDELAEERLYEALIGRPRDADTMGGLALIRLRQGHHAEAQAYFLQAQREDPARRAKWGDMARTANYWGLLREAGDATESGEFTLAEQKLREAFTADPREPAALVALGRVYAAQHRVGDAEKIYRAALALNRSYFGALRALIMLYVQGGREQAAQEMLAGLSAVQKKELGNDVEVLRASMLQEQAEALLQQKKTDEAIALLSRAVRYDVDNPWLRYDLARLYAAQGQVQKGQQLFDDLLLRRPDDPAARYAFALFQSKQGQEVEALTTLERIAADHRNEGMTSLQRRLWVGVVGSRASALAKAGQRGAAGRLLTSTSDAIGSDPELALDIATAQIDIGDLAPARALLDRFDAAISGSADLSLRRARLYGRAGSDSELPALFDRLALMRLSGEQAGGLNDLKRSLMLRDVERLRSGGRFGDALQLLQAHRSAGAQNSDELGELGELYAEGRILRALKRPGQAEAVYRRIVRIKPDEYDAEASLIETLIESGERAEALRRLEDRLAHLPAGAPDFIADLISSLIDLEQYERAWQLTEFALSQTPDHPRILGYAGRLASRDEHIDDAIAYMQRSLAQEAAQRNPAVAAPLSLVRYEADDTEPGRSTLVVDTANATTTGIDQAVTSRYHRLADLLDQNTTWLSSAIDKRTRIGSSGKSQYDATEIPIEWKQPLDGRGRLFVRGDIVTLNAGALDLADTSTAATFGTTFLCQPLCNTGLYGQSASGLALGVGLERNDQRIDIGTTPLGFPVQSIVGGILQKGDLGPFSYSVDLSRRAVTGSVLSYAGAKDPNTGETWGGVRATGVRFGLSLDNGGLLGAWSSLGLHKLTGKNVQDNNRMQLMSGGIVRLINEEDRLLSTGLTGMFWRFSENAGEYTFGHGGYYSPGSYKSLSLPITFGQRFSRFSYAARVAVSVSVSEAKSADWYPTSPLMQSQAEILGAANGTDPHYSGGTSRSYGRSLSFAGEYQMTPSLFVGGRIELDRSPDYAPNRFLLYFRYSVDRASAKPVSFVPQAVYPSSQY